MSEARAGEFVTVAKVGEIPEGGVKVARIGDMPVAVFRLADGYYALEDVCTHDGGELASGFLEGDVIECPRHGARFDVKTGAVRSLPATAPVPRYEVKVVGDEIQVATQSGYDGKPSDANPSDERNPAAAEPATKAGAVTAESAKTAAASTAGGSAGTPGAAPSAPSQQELAIRSALETVMDPEIGLSVIDLGLIRTVDIQPDKIRIDMLLTTPFCPYAPQMIADVKAATQSVVPRDCDVEILPDPWSPDLMPDPGLLGFSY